MTCTQYGPGSEGYPTDPDTLAELRACCEAGFHVVPGMALALLDALDRARDTAASLEVELALLADHDPPRPPLYMVPEWTPDPDRMPR